MIYHPLYKDRPLPVINNYSQWKSDNLDLFEDLETQYEKCSTCKGEGIIECECCGRDRDCLDCNGTGHLGEIAPNVYRKQLEKDLDAYAKSNPGWVIPVSLIYLLEHSEIDLLTTTGG